MAKQPEKKSLNYRAKLTLENVKQIKPAESRFEVTDTEIPGFKLRVMPSGVMTYAVMYRNGSKRVRYTLGKHGTITPDIARKLAKSALGQAAIGNDPQAEKKKTYKKDSIPTLKQYVDEKYLPWFESQYKTTGTRRAFNIMTDLHKVKLDQITAWKVERWRKARIEAGLKKSSINRYVTTLKAALNRAVEWNIIPANEMAGVKIYKEDNRSVIRYLSQAEEKRLRKALDTREKRLRADRESGNAWRKARGHDLLPDLDGRFADHLKPLVLLSINTGLRQGEIFSLTWQDYIKDRSQLIIHGKTSKSKTTRYIPVNTEAASVLEQWKKQADSDYIFPGKYGERLNNVNRAWRALLKLAEITGFRWHDMRHHFASRLVMSGVDLNTVRELLGHSDIKMTLRYAHLAPEHTAAAVELISGGQ